MENTVELKSWDHFKKTVEALYEDTSIGTIEYKSQPLFRGHSDSHWGLMTTLERSQTEPFSFIEYFQLVLSVQAEIETFTGQNWAIPEFNDLRGYSENYDNLWKPFPAYEYFVYLRHHGFPSPLLDWSASPYIAAFFAYSNETDAKDVAIYCFQERLDFGKFSSSDKPHIKSLGPRVKSHKRHFLQQSHYTICANFKDAGWFYGPHEDVFNLGMINQDRLTKYILPASERRKILADLNLYNISAFSLFQNEEALLETLSLRELMLRRR